MEEPAIIDQARAAAVAILKHNLHGPYRGLPRTAGWGYPEPYTRDLMIATAGYLVSGEKELIAMTRRVLETVARNQTARGHIPSMIHDPNNRGASDTTPLFLLATAMYREHSGEADFLKDAVERALTWMAYQSPGDRVIVGQLPTTDWRDEHWVLGFGLFVNTVVYSYLRAHHRHADAETLRGLMRHFDLPPEGAKSAVLEGLKIKKKPYFALWSFKVYNNERFDLLGNSIAILSGLAPPTAAQEIINWVERECDQLRSSGDLAVGLPPNLLPFIQPEHADWRPRYALFNMPGDYHNGGVWPFICGYYVAALVAAGRMRLARQNLQSLAEMVIPARDHDVDFGFNEYYKAQTGEAAGQDWQTWSAAMYLYAYECVKQESTPFFDRIRAKQK